MIQTIIANIKFELNIRLRSLSTYVYFIMFFALSMIMGLASGGAFGGTEKDIASSLPIFLQ